MILKVIQLNIWHFRLWEKSFQFLKEQNPDIVNLQEVSNGIFLKDKQKSFSKTPLEDLAELLGMNYYFAPEYGLESDGKVSQVGNAILSKFPIIDSGSFFESTLGPYRLFKYEDDAMKVVIGDEKSKYSSVFYLPKNLSWVVLEVNGKYLKTLNAHFTVSYECTETLQHQQQTQNVLNYLENTKQTPTIFTGDLNIHPESLSVSKLKEKLNLLENGEKNTLDPRIHPIFKNKEKPSLGLKTDYIFYKDLKPISYNLHPQTVSDHISLISKFEI